MLKLKKITILGFESDFETELKNKFRLKSDP